LNKLRFIFYYFLDLVDNFIWRFHLERQW